MQAAPAYEAMYLHGILHRIEGDIDNTRAWYRDVKDQEVFKAAWPGDEGLERAMDFLKRVETLKESVRKGQEGDGDQSASEQSLSELRDVLEFCELKFGTGKVLDATGIFLSMSEKNKDIAEKMINGGEGWRRF